MRRLLRLVLVVAVLAVPASALEVTAPPVPESGRNLMPSDTSTFAEGLLELLGDAAGFFRPDLCQAAGVCGAVIAVVMAVSLMETLPGSSSRTVELAGTVAVAVMLLGASDSMIGLGTDTVGEISEYGKLFLPVMTAAMAAQGGVTTASALYAGSAFFNSFLSGMIASVLTPMVYLFLALSICSGAVGEDVLKKLRDTAKWTTVWVLKTILYIFTGYIGITRVVSGTTDAAALKAAKLTISGVVPVVGGILSDASEAVLVSAGTVKNAAGVYGLLAILAVWLGPFVKIGTHYLMLKLTAGICGIFANKRMSELVNDFAAAMGFVVAMTGAVSLMLMISTVCFMKGVS